MAELQKISVKIADEEQYNAVTEALRSMGYKADPNPRWSDWKFRDSAADLFVLTTKDGYGIYVHSGGDGYTQYTVDEFLSKYGSLTKPLTIGEIHQLRELLKAHSPKPEPKPETYEGVFYFSHHDSRPMCGLNDGYLYFHTVLKRWIVGAMNPETKTHTLIEAPHEVGHFYLLAEGFDPKDPTNYGLYDGERFWNWTLSGCILKETTATNLKVVKA
jgi:hypothetical protein